MAYTLQLGGCGCAGGLVGPCGRECATCPDRFNCPQLGQIVDPTIFNAPTETYGLSPYSAQLLPAVVGTAYVVPEWGQVRIRVTGDYAGNFALFEGVAQPTQTELAQYVGTAGKVVSVWGQWNPNVGYQVDTWVPGAAFDMPKAPPGVPDNPPPPELPPPPTDSGDDGSTVPGEPPQGQPSEPTSSGGGTEPAGAPPVQEAGIGWGVGLALLGAVLMARMGPPKRW